MNDFSLLRKIFHLKINIAAKKLKISEKKLVKNCRLTGINRWPYKTIHTLFKIKLVLKKYHLHSHKHLQYNKMVKEYLEYIYTTNNNITFNTSNMTKHTSYLLRLNNLNHTDIAGELDNYIDHEIIFYTSLPICVSSYPIFPGTDDPPLYCNDTEINDLISSIINS
jgi:hypothetical protein